MVSLHQENNFICPLLSDKIVACNIFSLGKNSHICLNIGICQEQTGSWSEPADLEELVAFTVLSMINMELKSPSVESCKYEVLTLVIFIVTAVAKLIFKV